MRASLFVWIAIFCIGALVGDRYGAPGVVTGLTDSAFGKLEGWVGGLAAPLPRGGDIDKGPQTSDGYGQSARAEADTRDDAISRASAGVDNSRLRINEAGLRIIKESEGLRLEAYNVGGQWLIGYGHTRTARAGMKISEAEADRLLREDVEGAEESVRAVVTAPLNENQFSAMVSLAYNLGIGGFKKTTVFERINKGDYQGAADGFLNHDRARVDRQLKPIAHLTERRQKERALFLTPV